MLLDSSSGIRAPAARRLILAGATAGALAVAALVAAATGGPPPEQAVAKRFVAAWARGDYAAMHAELTPADRRATSLRAFAAAYRGAAATATATGNAAARGAVSEPSDGVVSVPMTVRTRIFGTIRQTLRLPFAGDGDDRRIDWSPSLAFPGVAPGARLRRETRLAPRAAILARDGTPLVRGDDHGNADVAASIIGELGAPAVERLQRLYELGFPPDTEVGVSGLERVFDERLIGTPGGELRAGDRLLASSRPRPARPVRTSIDLDVERAAIVAKGDRLGGVAVVSPRTGEILALAGIAFSGLQPPGSTFKIVTLAGVLEARLATPASTYPVETKTTIEGVELENAHGESCGGTLRSAFAHSCNSVFAPLGVKLGAARLVATAERFGFNAELGIPAAATSTIPSAGEIGDALAVGSSAIGQGRVQATALQMAWVAATIAGRGLRPRLTLERERTPQRTRVVRAEVARVVGRLMEAVVREGTGAAAKIDGVRVAGKTGTAELKDTSIPECVPDPDPEAAPCPPPEPDDPTDTDAWFAAYAPANAPRIAVGVLLVEAGAGGDTAAPVAREVLLAGLRATR